LKLCLITQGFEHKCVQWTMEKHFVVVAKWIITMNSCVYGCSWKLGNMSPRYQNFVFLMMILMRNFYAPISRVLNLWIGSWGLAFQNSIVWLKIGALCLYKKINIYFLGTSYKLTIWKWHGFIPILHLKRWKFIWFAWILYIDDLFITTLHHTLKKITWPTN
jgi:hypothetical protein